MFSNTSMSLTKLLFWIVLNDEIVLLPRVARHGVDLVVAPNERSYDSVFSLRKFVFCVRSALRVAVRLRAHERRARVVRVA